MKRVLLIVCLILSVLVPSLAQATIIFSEDYEVANGNMNTGGTSFNALMAKGWSVTDSACPVNVGLTCFMDIVTSPVHSGSKALRMSFPLGQNTEFWAANLVHTTGVTEFYERFWVRWETIDTGQASTINGKLHYYDSDNGRPNFILLGGGGQFFNCPECLYVQNQTNVTHTCPNGGSDVTCNLSENAGADAFNRNQWYCIETHFSQSQVEVWVDGNLKISYSANVVFEPIYNKINVFRQQEWNVYRYEDDYVVGTTRVGGCPGSVSDTAPPTASVLSITADGSATWTASSDNVGVANYTVLFCTPAACTPAQQVTTTVNLFATVTQTGDYAVIANDAAGNHSVLSNIVSFTAPTPSSRTVLATDGFVQVDENPLSSGGKWIGGYTSQSDCQVVSHMVEGTTINTNCFEAYAGLNNPVDQWASATIGTWTGAQFGVIGATLDLATSPTLSGYQCFAVLNPGAGSHTTINRADTGANLATESSTTWIAGDTIRCENVGGVLSAYRITAGGVETKVLGPVSDTTFTSGKTGLVTFLATGGTLANLQISSWSTGGFGPATPPSMTSFTPTTTGATLSWSATTPPTSIRIESYTATGVFSSVIYPLSTFSPSGTTGTYVHAWDATVTSACAFAIDAGGVENDVATGYQCNVVPPAGPVDHGPATGVLRHLGTTPWLTNDSGNAIFLTGISGGYDGNTAPFTPDNPNPAIACFQDTVSSGTPITYDYAAAFAAVAARNHTLVRCWGMHYTSWGTANMFNTNTQDRIPINQLPWLQVGSRVDTTTGNNVTVGVYDLSQFNQTYFDRLRARALSAVNQGLTFSFILFEQTVIENTGLSASPTHAFYCKDASHCNNVNGVNPDTNADGFITEIATLASGVAGANITALQDAYVRKVVDTLNDIDGIMYEVCNECQSTSVAWIDHIADTIVNYEATGGRKVHPVHTSPWGNADGNNANNIADTHLQIAQVQPETGQLYDTNPPVNTGTKPIFHDSDHLGAHDLAGVEVAGFCWKSFTRGIMPILLDGRESSGVRTALKTECGQTVTYANKMHLAGMLPVANTTIIATGYGLKEDCKEYLMFQPSAATNAIDLTSCGAGSAFTVEYLNPATGVVTTDTNVTGGASRNFTAAAMRVVYLKLSPPPPDTTPPTIFGCTADGQVSGSTLPIGTTSTNIQCLTNENATLKYGLVAGVAYASQPNTFVTTGGTTHSVIISGLTNGSSTALYIRGIDTSGNADTSDTVMTWSVGQQSDLTAPIMSNPSPSTVLPAGTTSTIISFDVNETATCKYDTTDTTFTLMANLMTVTALKASATVTGLTDNSTTLYYARCQDAASPTPNVDTASLVITVSVAAAAGDTTVPSTVTGLVGTVISQTQVSLSWTAATDNVAVSGYNVYLGFVSDLSDAVLIQQLGNTTTTIANLLPNTTHYFGVKAVDSSNNLSAAYSNIVTVVTLPPADIVPPSDMTNLHVDNGQIYAKSVVLAWDQGTDNMGSITTTIEMCAGTSLTCTDANYAVVVSKLALNYLVVSLSPSTHYAFRGKFTDTSGNSSVNYSNIVDILTPASGLPVPRIDTPFGFPRSGASRSSSGTRTPR